MSIHFDGGLGMILVLALFFYLVIYFAVKHAIIAAHTQMEESKKNFEVEEKINQDQENTSRTEEKRAESQNVSVRSNTVDMHNDSEEDNSMDQHNSSEEDYFWNEYNGLEEDSNTDKNNNLR